MECSVHGVLHLHLHPHVLPTFTFPTLRNGLSVCIGALGAFVAWQENMSMSTWSFKCHLFLKQVLPFWNRWSDMEFSPFLWVDIKLIINDKSLSHPKSKEGICFFLLVSVRRGARGIDDWNPQIDHSLYGFLINPFVWTKKNTLSSLESLEFKVNWFFSKLCYKS